MLFFGRAMQGPEAWQQGVLLAQHCKSQASSIKMVQALSSCQSMAKTVCVPVQDHMDIESLERHNDRAIDALSDRISLLKNVRKELTSMQQQMGPGCAAATTLVCLLFIAC